MCRFYIHVIRLNYVILLVDALNLQPTAPGHLQGHNPTPVASILCPVARGPTTSKMTGVTIFVTCCFVTLMLGDFSFIEFSSWCWICRYLIKTN